jgi:hypothetical protein
MATEPSVKEHERSDASGKGVFIVIVSLFVCGLGLHGILAGFLHALKSKAPFTDRWEPVLHTKAPRPVNAAFPRLQVSPKWDLQEFRAQEDKELLTYGWINRTAGIVRVPIQRAMDLVLAQGLKSRTGSNTNQLGPSTYQLIEKRPEHREPEIQGQK